MSYEYKVVPAPTRGVKAKGRKTAEDRFANALETTMNDLAQDGWEYMRTDTLPSEQRDGIMSKTTVYQNMLVFRRSLTAIAKQPASAPAKRAPAPQPAPAPVPVPPVAPPVQRVEPPVDRPLPPLKSGAERIAEKVQPKADQPDLAAE